MPDACSRTAFEPVPCPWTRRPPTRCGARAGPDPGPTAALSGLGVLRVRSERRLGGQVRAMGADAPLLQAWVAELRAYRLPFGAARPVRPPVGCQPFSKCANGGEEGVSGPRDTPSSQP